MPDAEYMGFHGLYHIHFNFGVSQSNRVSVMPQKITCSECGQVLYEGDILKSPQDIIKKYDGKCPKCGRKLDYSTNSVAIYPCEQ
jgi:transcription initiation factor IIE alpha subunit